MRGRLSAPVDAECVRCGGVFQKVVAAKKYCALCGPVAYRESKRRNRRLTYLRQSEASKARRRERDRERRKLDPEKFRAKDRERYLRRRSASLARLREWRESNRDEDRRRARDYYYRNAEKVKAKRKTEDYRAAERRRQAARRKLPKNIIRERMTARINCALRYGKGGRSWRGILGYSVDDLRVSLERQFLPGMSWGNIDEWDIDHIVPVACFEFDSFDSPEFKACFALTNLRPLWREENRRKSAQRLFLI